MSNNLAAVALGTSIVLLSAGQIAQKIAARQIFDNDTPRSLLARALFSQALWVAAACLMVGTLSWLLTLSQIEVSKAYPILGLNFVLTTIIAKVFLAERVNSWRWLGIAMIILGAAMMAKS